MNTGEKRYSMRVSKVVRNVGKVAWEQPFEAFGRSVAEAPRGRASATDRAGKGGTRVGQLKVILSFKRRQENLRHRRLNPYGTI